MSAEENREELNQPKPEDSRPGAKPGRAVFSDAFDDPERKEPKEELPDDEPLTPELVEEEAIRGDFMLRWATIFLAVLMAFTQISDTKPLTLIRSGDYMRSHGFLPPRTDQLSLTAEGKPFANVSWLFDHIVSFAWSAGGPMGLTVLKVVLAGLSAWLLTRISIPGVSTWWSSICAALAVVACSQDYIPASELISVLGMTLLMHFLIQHRLGTSSTLHWKLPLLFAVWCNLDSKAWVGVYVVVLYALGNAVTRRGILRSDGSSERAPLPFGMIALLCMLALLVNPFPAASLLTPITTYSTEYPAMQSQKSLTSGVATVSYDNRVDYFSILTPDAVVLFDHTHVAGIAVLLIGFVIVFLAVGGSDDRTRVPFGSRILKVILLLQAIISGRPVRDAALLFSLGGIAFLVLLKAHELPAAAIVAAVTGGIVAQEWYRRSFSMKYSTDSRELLFSRGGRAVTVLSMALLGFCVVASRLPGAAPLGIGFDQDTQITIDTVSNQIKSLDESAHVLHTRLEHGDLLIWNGRKSFIDSRVLPFGRPGDRNSIFGQHSNVLQTVLQPPQPPTDTTDPKEKERYEQEMQKNQADASATLDTFEITHIMVRLAPPGRPDYASMRNLAATGKFLPVSIEASAALMERIAPNATPEEIGQKAPDFIRKAFRDEVENPPTLRQFATAPTFAEKHIYRRRRPLLKESRLAGHYLFLAVPQPQSPEQAMNSLALLTLAIRNLNASLQTTPDDPVTMASLGVAYLRLGMMEEMLNGGNVVPRMRQIRNLQASSAFWQAIKMNPEMIEAWNGLIAVYERMGRQDLLLKALEQWLVLADKAEGVSAEQREAFAEERTRRYAGKRELEDQLAEADEALDRQIENALANKPKMESPANKEESAVDQATIEEARDAMLTSMVCNLAGRPVRALQALRDHAAAVQATPEGSLMMGQLMLEVGEVEEAHQLLLPISQEALRSPASFQGMDWQLPVAASQLATCDYAGAGETWLTSLKDIEKQLDSPSVYLSSLMTMPLVADANVEINGQLPVWPVRTCMNSNELISSSGSSRSEIALVLAMVRIEEGNLKEAKSVLRRVITECGETPYTGIARIYYAMLDADAIKVLDDFRYEPWEAFDFPGEPEPPKTPPAAAGQPKQ
ncbi:MAG: hypothetical protein JNM43_08580 [Planctomycetaceae bacterium]|nr:hypothetical protein [Planctomycetaceae bacterium]